MQAFCTVIKMHLRLLREMSKRWGGPRDGGWVVEPEDGSARLSLQDFAASPLSPPKEGNHWPGDPGCRFPLHRVESLRSFRASEFLGCIRPGVCFWFSDLHSLLGTEVLCYPHVMVWETWPGALPTLGWWGPRQSDLSPDEERMLRRSLHAERVHMVDRSPGLEEEHWSLPASFLVSLSWLWSHGGDCTGLLAFMILVISLYSSNPF